MIWRILMEEKRTYQFTHFCECMDPEKVSGTNKHKSETSSITSKAVVIRTRVTQYPHDHSSSQKVHSISLFECRSRPTALRRWIGQFASDAMQTTHGCIIACFNRFQLPRGKSYPSSRAPRRTDFIRVSLAANGTLDQETIVGIPFHADSHPF
jgi:hypothetical protein